MVNAFKKGKKLLKKLADKAAATRLGKQVMKIPAPIRKGYAAGLMVPVPGAGTAGALAGTGVWAKRRIEDGVRKSTGQPYRLFETPASLILGDAYVRMEFAQLRETQEEETARDRRTLGRIAAGTLAAGGLAAMVIHKGRIAKPVQFPDAVVPAPKVPRAKKVQPPSGAWGRKKPKKKTDLEVTGQSMELGAKFRMGSNGDMLWKSAAASVRPDDFLKAASKFGKAGPYLPAVEKYRAMIRAGEKIDMPFLSVERAGKGLGYHPANYKVVGHEGRHRMIAAKLEGVEKVPVEIKAGLETRYPKRTPIQKRSMKKVAYFQPEANFQTPARAIIDFGDGENRDNLSRGRDASIIAGTGAVGAGAMITAYQARKLGRRLGDSMAYASSGIARTAKQVRETVTPEAVAREGVKIVKRKAASTAGKHFPTFIKAGKAIRKVIRKFETPAQRMGVIDFAFGKAQRKAAEVLREKIAGDLRTAAASNQLHDGSFRAHIGPMQKRLSDLEGDADRLKKRDTRIAVGGSVVVGAGGVALLKKKRSEKKSFTTPAQRMGVIEFASTDQLIDRRTKEYAGPLRVAAGTQDAYHRGDKSKTQVDLPIGDMQVIRAAHRKAEGLVKWGGRGGRLAKDASDVVRGKPRERDTSGRKKKREWEKSWASKAAKDALMTGGVLGYTAGMKFSPRFRAANVKAGNWVVKKANKFIPNMFETPAPCMGITFLAAKKEKDEKPSAAGVGVQAAGAGAVAGGYWGAASALGTPEAARYVDAKLKPMMGGGDKGYGLHDGQAVAPKSSKPFKKRGKFGAAERTARANHEIGKRFKKVLIKRGVIGGAIGAAALGGLGYAGARAEANRGKRKNFSMPKPGFINKLRGPTKEALALLESRKALLAKMKLQPGAKAKHVTNQVEWNVKNHKAAIASAKGRQKVARRKLVLGGAAGAGGLMAGSIATRDADEKQFITPTQRMGVIEFDGVAAEAGWDVRDPRGRSARVFAPGSRKRVRREKEWSEEVGNERKLWKGAVVGAGLLAAAGGVAIGRRFPRKKPTIGKSAVFKNDDKIVRMPRRDVS